MKIKKFFLIIFLISLTLHMISCISAKKETKYFITVDDHQIFEQIKNTIDSNENSFYIIEENESLFLEDEKNIIIGTIKINERLADFPSKNSDTTFSYQIDSRFLVPSIECDFSKESNNKKIIDPSLDIQISTPDKIPQNHRALPVDSLYAGDENYSLEIKKFADCTILCGGEKADELKDFFKTIFSEPIIQKDNVAFITNVGDIMVSRGVEDILMEDEDNLEKVFSTTLPILQNADFTMGNLEGAVTDLSKRTFKTYTFKFNKKVLPSLKKAGFDYLMLTNNHCYDYGEEGFKDTLAALKEYNIPTSGAGYNKNEAEEFFTTEIKGQKFAIISVGAYPTEKSGFNGKTMASATENRAGILWQSDQVLADVNDWSKKGYTVLVNVHGGEEYVLTPSKSQREFYQSLIDHGAKVVYGSHPHVLQPTEWYKDGLIVYSMGNFVFPGMGNMPNATKTELVKIGFSQGKIVYLEQYPAVIKNTKVELLQN